MKKFITLILTAIMSFSACALVGCTPETAENNTKSFFDFEQIVPDIQIMRVMDGFGKVSLNEDAKFVKSGKSSAKLQPLGYAAINRDPYVYLPLFSSTHGYNFSDLTKVDSFSMWLYNAQETDARVELGYMLEDWSVNSSATGGKQKKAVQYNLKPGWNNVTVVPSVDEIAISYDPKLIYGLYLKFDRTASYDLSDSPVFYLDDVTVDVLETAKTVNSVVTLDKGEIIDFEKAYQHNVVEAAYHRDTISTIVGQANKIETKVTGKKAGVIPTSGDYMLEAVLYPNKEFEYRTFGSIMIPQEIIDASELKDLPVEKRDDYKICFDVYAESKAMNFTFNIDLFDFSVNNASNIHFSTKLGQWKTIEMPLTAISAAIKNDPGRLRIDWWSYMEDEVRTFYFDNFRIEKVL